MKTFLMNNGREIPALGFGTYKLGDREICGYSVETAIRVGYRLIDTAAMYMNEEGVADGIRMSGVPRSEIFLTTKVWLQDCGGYDRVRPALERSLRRLGTDYLDLYLIHWPFVDLEGTWKALEKLSSEGLIRSIGVCNCRETDLKRILADCSIVPAVNQLETHPLNQQKSVRKFQEQYGILTEAWGVLGRAMPQVMDNPALCAAAAAHGKTVPQVMLRFCYQEGIIGIPRSSSVARIVENRRIWDFELSEEEMEQLRGIDTGERLISRTDPDDPASRQKLIDMRFDI